MDLVQQRLAIPELPEQEINHLIRVLNRANRAMQKFHEGSGLEGVRQHFELVEVGRKYFEIEKQLGRVPVKAKRAGKR